MPTKIIVHAEGVGTIQGRGFISFSSSQITRAGTIQGREELKEIRYIRNDVQQIYMEKSQLTSLAWGSLWLTPINKNRLLRLSPQCCKFSSSELVPNN